MMKIFKIFLFVFILIISYTPSFSQYSLETFKFDQGRIIYKKLQISDEISINTGIIIQDLNQEEVFRLIVPEYLDQLTEWEDNYDDYRIYLEWGSYDFSHEINGNELLVHVNLLLAMGLKYKDYYENTPVIDVPEYALLNNLFIDKLRIKPLILKMYKFKVDLTNFSIKIQKDENSLDQLNLLPLYNRPYLKAIKLCYNEGNNRELDSLWTIDEEDYLPDHQYSEGISGPKIENLPITSGIYSPSEGSPYSKCFLISHYVTIPLFLNDNSRLRYLDIYSEDYKESIFEVLEDMGGLLEKTNQ